MKHLIALAALFCSFQLIAHDEDQLGRIVGDKIDLNYSNHSADGKVNGQALHSKPVTGKPVYELTLHYKDQDLTSTFGQAPGGFAGKITSLNEQGEKKTTEFKVTKVAMGKLEGTVDGKPFTMKVSAKSVEAGHFVNPHFEADVNGKKVEFDLENGHACMMCSLRIAFVVLGTLGATGGF